jgi:glycosyltransferase involved in cell wall biosynthesis
MQISVLIVSFQRPDRLQKCLESISAQTRPPDEVVVVWQADDVATRDAAESHRGAFRDRLKIVRSIQKGIVTALNCGLTNISGEIVLLIDDDAVAPADWASKHASHFANESVTIVGGPFKNFFSDERSFPTRSVQPTGRLTSYGRLLGNTFDHPGEWAQRQTVPVQHVSGGNLSFRRNSIKLFDAHLRPYWQYWEVDMCLQALRGGGQVLFDFSNVVRHYPSNLAHDGIRGGNLAVKFGNPNYNLAFVLSKHSPMGLRVMRLCYLLLVGAHPAPGLLRWPISVVRHRNLVRETRIHAIAFKNTLAGWFHGRRHRKLQSRSESA